MVHRRRNVDDLVVTVRLAAAFVAAFTCLALAAPGASASSLTCQVSASASAEPAMHILGGSGRYSLSSPGGLVTATTCSADGGERQPSVIRSSGAFDNVLCGWATLHSPHDSNDVSTIDVGGDGAIEVHSLRYRLTLRSWTAYLEVERVNGLPEQGGEDVDGVLALRPQNACTFAQVGRFTLDGVLTIDW